MKATNVWGDCPQCHVPIPMTGRSVALTPDGVMVCSVWCSKRWTAQKGAVRACRAAVELTGLLRGKKPTTLSSAGESGGRTEFWRTLSWILGDDHANRLCRIIDFYCRVHGIDPARFHQMRPR